MHRTQQVLSISFGTLFLLTLLAALPGYLYAKESIIEMPENAHERKYGSGWECDLSLIHISEPTRLQV